MGNKLKVLILAPIQHDFPPIGYGPWELVAYNIAEGLIDLGVDVTVYAPKNAKTRAKVLGSWDTSTDEKSTDNDAKTWIHISEAMRISHEYDVIHNNLNIHPVLFSKVKKMNLVTTLHGAASEMKNKLYYEYLSDAKFVSISDAERKFMPDLNYLATVYNGVDFNKYKLSKGKGEYLVFSGRIVPEKGIEEAITLSKETGIPLKIAGLITDQEYFDKIVTPNLGKNIGYVGNLAYEEYSELLLNAKALLSFNHWEEPFGLTNIDALASGLPVIGFNKGAIGEIIYDEKMGKTFENLEDAILFTKNLPKYDPGEIRKLAEAKFSRQKMAEGYLDVYKKVIES